MQFVFRVGGGSHGLVPEYPIQLVDKLIGMRGQITAKVASSLKKANPRLDGQPLSPGSLGK